MENDLFCRREELVNRILYETENFYVLVGKGIITPGHVMLIPKDHYPTFGDLPEELEEEFLTIKDYIIQRITKHFSAPFLAEHGVCRQTVSHAHIHFIPKKGEGYELKSIFKEVILPSKLPYEIVDRKELQEAYNTEGGYVTLEEDCKIYLFRATKMLEQEQNKILYRSFFADRLGLSTPRSWKTMKDEEIEIDNWKVEKTKRELNF